MKSTWRRARADTDHFRKSAWSFWAFEIVGAAMLALIGGLLGFLLLPTNSDSLAQWGYPALGGAIGVVGGLPLAFGVILLWNLFRAPYRQRDEARRDLEERNKRIDVLEDEKKPRVEVHPFSCKPSLHEATPYTAWAELQVRNTSTSPLQEVSVQIQDCIGVYKVQDGPDKDKYYLGTGMEPQWRPANVYWSESNTGPKQLTVRIPAGATLNAVIAFHAGYLGSALGTFNTPTYPPFLEHKVVIEVSSLSMNTWRGEYYIEYHPARTDEFEFVEWDLWRSKHDVIEWSAVRRDKSGS